jgi:hypothetical protein
MPTELYRPGSHPAERASDVVEDWDSETVVQRPGQVLPKPGRAAPSFPDETVKVDGEFDFEYDPSPSRRR